MNNLITRIEDRINRNRAVEAEDIRALVKAYKSIPERLEQSLGLGNEYIIKQDDQYWIEHRQIGSAEPLKQWVKNVIQTHN